MKITANTGRQNKVHILIDGEYTFTVDAEYWYLCPYCKIKEITDSEEIDTFMTDIGSRYAFISGLRILSYGDNSRKELSRKLITKGHKPEYVALALDKLEEVGYINDMRFARTYADRLIRNKGMSKSGIRSEMMRKGFDRECISAVLEETQVDPVETAVSLIERKYKRYLGDEKGVRKITASLQRLGYSWSDIRSALNRAGAENEEDYND